MFMWREIGRCAVFSVVVKICGCVCVEKREILFTQIRKFVFWKIHFIYFSAKI